MEDDGEPAWDDGEPAWDDLDLACLLERPRTASTASDSPTLFEQVGVPPDVKEAEEEEEPRAEPRAGPGPRAGLRLIPYACMGPVQVQREALAALLKPAYGEGLLSQQPFSALKQLFAHLTKTDTINGRIAQWMVQQPRVYKDFEVAQFHESQYIGKTWHHMTHRYKAKHVMDVTGGFDNGDYPNVGAGTAFPQCIVRGWDASGRATHLTLCQWYYDACCPVAVHGLKEDIEQLYKVSSFLAPSK
jgi:hypothetical protein